MRLDLQKVKVIGKKLKDSIKYSLQLAIEWTKWFGVMVFGFIAIMSIVVMSLFYDVINRYRDEE